MTVMFPTHYKGYDLELLENVVVNISHIRKLAISNAVVKTLHEIIAPISSNISSNSDLFLQLILTKAKETIDDPEFDIKKSKSFQLIENELIEI